MTSFDSFDLMKPAGSRSGHAVFQPQFERLDLIRELRAGGKIRANGVICVLTADPIDNGDGSFTIEFETRS